jgi:hypothetical protein
MWFQVLALMSFDRSVFESGEGVYIEKRLANSCPLVEGGCLDRESVLRFTLLDLLLL